MLARNYKLKCEYCGKPLNDHQRTHYRAIPQPLMPQAEDSSERLHFEKIAMCEDCYWKEAMYLTPIGKQYDEGVE